MKIFGDPLGIDNKNVKIKLFTKESMELLFQWQWIEETNKTWYK